MPLTKLQSDILTTIARQRGPDSYVAGGIAINRDGPRFSNDIDIFHDGNERLAAVVEADLTQLRAHGFETSLVGAQLTDKRGASIARGIERTKIDWVADSDFRFFPAMPDPLFGFVLHPVDLAANKASAAADRRVPRDIVDLLTIHDAILPLGAVVSAMVGRFPGQSPEEILDQIRRHSRFTVPEFASLEADGSLDVHNLQNRISRMLSDAEAFVAKLPSNASGVVFLQDGKCVQPDIASLSAYVRHEGARRGHWPSSSEIGSAMLERYAQPRSGNTGKNS